LPYGVEVAGIAGAVIVVLVFIAGLRITHFRKNIQDLRAKVGAANQKARDELRTEINKGTGADVEAVINMANSLSPLDQMEKTLKRMDNSMQRGFVFDMVGIGMLVGVSILSAVEVIYDAGTVVFILVSGYFILIIEFGFVQNVRELFRVENQLNEPKGR
jgi:hypothetical protein